MDMPWQECSVINERLRIIAKPLDRESMTDLCRESEPIGSNNSFLPASHSTVGPPY